MLLYFCKSTKAFFVMAENRPRNKSKENQSRSSRRDSSKQMTISFQGIRNFFASRNFEIIVGSFLILLAIFLLVSMGSSLLTDRYDQAETHDYSGEYSAEGRSTRNAFGLLEQEWLIFLCLSFLVGRRFCLYRYYCFRVSRLSSNVSFSISKASHGKYSSMFSGLVLF